jgi:hypothetical protein
VTSGTPTSWREGGAIAPGEEEAARVIRLASGVEARPVDRHHGWDDVVDRYARRRSPPVAQVLVFAAAAACGALIVWTGLKPASREAPVVSHAPALPVREKIVAAPVPALAPRAETAPDTTVPQPIDERVGRAETAPAPHVFTASPGAQWTQGRAGVTRLEAGHFEAKASPQQPQKLQTPEVSIAATTARFAMDVTEQGTTVAVFEGTAEISTAHMHATLHAGQTRHFGADAPAVPREVVPLAVEPVALDQGSPACVHAGSLEAQLACLAAQAKGNDLKAQAALFEQGNLEAQAHRSAGAAETYRASLTRFPDGVLAPEVTLALMRLLASEQQYDGAIEAGSGFLKSWPDDPRCEDVKGFVSRLEWLRAR